MTNKIIPIKLLLFSIVLFLSANIQAADKITVYVSNYPVKYFVSRIAGDHTNTVLPIPSDIDPVDWQPDATTIVKYQAADLIVLNGANYEHWLNKVSLPTKKIVNTTKNLEDNLINIDADFTHSHGMKGEHAHDETASITWLDFSQAVEQAESILHALAENFPEYESDFGRNYNELKQDLLNLDQQLENLVQNKPALTLLASHPVYQYMQRRYGLSIETMHWEPDEYPNDNEWIKFGNLLGDHSAQWMLWEDVPLDETTEKLASIGIKSLVFSPCEKAPTDGDFLTVMKQNIKNLAQAFH